MMSCDVMVICGFAIYMRSTYVCVTWQIYAASAELYTARSDLCDIKNKLRIIIASSADSKTSANAATNRGRRGGNAMWNKITFSLHRTCKYEVNELMECVNLNGFCGADILMWFISFALLLSFSQFIIITLLAKRSASLFPYTPDESSISIAQRRI